MPSSRAGRAAAAIATPGPTHRLRNTTHDSQTHPFLLTRSGLGRLSGGPGRAAPARARRTRPPQTAAPWPLVAWTPIPENPVFAGTGRDTWDRKIRERGYILVGDDGTYHLWYTGYAADRPPTMSLGHATSRDGIHWTRDPANPIFTGSWVEDVCVVQHDGAYFMFAEGKNDIAHLLTSPDGRKWTDTGSLDIRKTDGSPISPGPYGTPAAWFEDGTWYLFYERGDQGVWLATSKDRKVWTNVKDDPVIAMGPEPYDQDGRGRQSDRQARRLLLRLLPRQQPASLERLDDLRSPIARPGALGEVSGQPDHPEQLLQRDPRPHPARPGPALHDASGRQGLRASFRRPSVVERASRFRLPLACDLLI